MLQPSLLLCSLLLLLLDTVSSQDSSCQCRPKAQCITQFPSLAQAATTLCPLPRGGQGFCCPPLLPSPPSLSTRLAPMADRRALARPETTASSEDIRESLGNPRAQRPRESRISQETQGHSQFTRARKEDEDLADAGERLFRLDDDLGFQATRRSSSRDEVGLDSSNSVEVEAACPWTTDRRPRCGPNTDRYRTVDGSCNNPRNPLLGMSGTPFQRILEATYHKRGNTPRVAGDGSQLPSARLVSQTVFAEGDPRNTDFSAHFMQFSQFVDHDLTHTPSPTPPPQCCLPDNRDRAWVFPPNPFNGQPNVCFPIEISPTDTFWGPRGRRCMALTRSEVSPTVEPFLCESGRWEQRNSLTHWLDGNQIYGSTNTESLDVRDRRDLALLAVTRTGVRGRDLLPSCRQARAQAEREEQPESCGCPGCAFIGGDLRVNEQPMLTVQHAVWVREHNRVAGALRGINPGWDDETVFQQTRRIVIAEWQHIIYSEWLPIVVGVSYTRIFGLQPLTSGYSQDYDPDFDPRVNNEFATAAFRFGHSLITPNVPGRSSSGRNTTRLDLRNVFNNGKFIGQRNFIDDTVRGLTQEPLPSFDPIFVDDILNHLFEGDEGIDGGLDLTALNIQRGREHGIPGYNEYRERCQSASSKFRKVKDFSQLTEGGWLSASAVSKLKAAYNSVDDIDLFVGGFMERPHRDALVGPTFKCIIGDQFTRLKRGDRFWYERGDDQTTRFSLDQLDELRKASMARIMCDNTDIESAQPLMMRTPSRGNELVSCSDRSIPRLNLEVFKEK